MISLHHVLSLYLVHSKYETFLFAVFQEQLNNLSHFRGFCVPIVELCMSPGYCCLSKPESWFCDRYGFSHSVQVLAFSAIFLVTELRLCWPTADVLNQGLEDSCFVQLFTVR